MSRVLVTGACGFIGKNIVKYLLDEGHEVIGSSLHNIIVDERMEITHVPIFCNASNLYEILGSPDICIHLAWKDGFVHNSAAHMSNLSNHIGFCRKMLDSDLKKLICIGSMHEVGYWEGMISKDTPCNPQTQYGIAKYAMRKSLELYSNDKNCKFNWLRGYYIESPDPKGNSIFSKIVRAAVNGDKKFPFNSGKNRCDFLEMGEFVKQFVAASLQTKYDGIIEICSGEPIALSDRIESFIKINNLDIELDYGKFPDRPYDSPEIYGDSSIIDSIMVKWEQRITRQRNRV